MVTVVLLLQEITQQDLDIQLLVVVKVVLQVLLMTQEMVVVVEDYRVKNKMALLEQEFLDKEMMVEVLLVMVVVAVAEVLELLDNLLLLLLVEQVVMV